MTSDTPLRRRRFLALAGIAAATGLAGCTTSNADDQPGGNESGSNASGDGNDSHAGNESHDDDHAGNDSHDGSHEENESHDDGHEHGHGGAVGEPVDLAEVGMASTSDGQHFEPHVVWVNRGGTVRWTNESGAHSTTAYHPDNDKPRLVPEGAQSWDSGVLTEAGAEFEHTFATEGVYHYYCTPHESLGMIGSVIVGKPDPHDQPALGEPPAELSATARKKIKELNATCNEALGHTH
ncbi:cupredoxin domain-containing protein [Halomarina pelagica]|uniref:cupredoxin domain-containing protein n=1 Tax=Halomarina pelagica TaxID=2961599 RepID=UPI0020C4E8BB|nr:plastocyanin/azurin family copper-binding protein [Halomarina sp. BND7]